MSGPDQPAQPFRPREDEDLQRMDVHADQAGTTVVNAEALDTPAAVPSAGEQSTESSWPTSQAWSRTNADAPADSGHVTRGIRQVDDDDPDADPTEAPLARTSGSSGGSSPYRTQRAPSPYQQPSPPEPHAQPTSGRPLTGQPNSPSPVHREQPTQQLCSPEPETTRSNEPFASSAPAVAPFPRTGADESDDTATRALSPAPGTTADPFARDYPAAPETPAQPAYIPPPAPVVDPTDERDTFIGQSARPDEPDLLPEKRRIWQNLLGALIGLVLVLGPIIAFALLAGSPDSLFSAETSRKILLLGLIVIAAAPALLAGWAPSTALVPGVILAIVGSIAWLSTSFTNQLGRWSSDLFATPVVGTFVATIGVFLGFGLLFAGLGTAWARSLGADTIIKRFPVERGPGV